MPIPDARLKFNIVELLSKKMTQRPEKDFTGKEFHFDIKADLSVNPNDRLIIILVDVKIRELNKDFELGSVSVACGFEVENFEESILKQDDNSYIIPQNVDILTKSVAISTTRGIMFSEFKGTYLFKAILPIIILQPPIEEQPEKPSEKTNT